jgi:hypothetical protein
MLNGRVCEAHGAYQAEQKKKVDAWVGVQTGVEGGGERHERQGEGAQACSRRAREHVSLCDDAEA